MAVLSGTIVATSASAGPPTLPPLMFQPFGFQQQLLPGQPQASFITPKPMAVMEPLFTLPAQPFGELGHNLTGSPTQSVPHRQPIAPDPLPGSGGGGGGAAAGGGPKFMPAPGYSRTPWHRRPLGW